MTIKERIDVYEKLMRLDKPIGILLLLWPTLWGLWLSSYGHPNPAIVVIFILGVVLMRSAGCIVNDFADRNFDPHVERTKDRPLAARLISPLEALLVAGVLILLAFLLVLQLNALTIKLSVVACLLALVYPFLKRYFWLPQAWLGIAFGFGIPMAYAAQRNNIPPVAWALLAANVFCHTLFLSIMTYIGTWARLGLFYFVGLVIAACLAGYQYLLIHERQRERCFRAFLNNNWLGAAIYAGIVADFLLRIPLFSVTAAVITH